MRSRDLTTSCGWATSKGDDGSLVAPTLFAGTRLMLPTSTKARVYIGITFLGGLLSLSLGLLHGEWTEPSRYICYLALALLASCMKVSLPGVHGTMSVIFLFILVGVRELTLRSEERRVGKECRRVWWQHRVEQNSDARREDHY